MTALLSNIANPIVTSTINASSVRAAFNSVRPKITRRKGLGRIAVTGGFTGLTNADLDIEILGNPGSVLRTSEPTFIGSGTGVISDISANAGAVAEKITITLSDVGTSTKPASIDFFGATLIARPTGALGNTIYLTVDTSHIQIEDTSWSTLKDIERGTLTLDGPEWTFGSLPLLGDGTLNSASVRFRFGDDPTVYREYSVFENGKTVFKLDRELVNSVKAGTPLKKVTGYYDLTITYGATVETYSNLITLYDALSAIKAKSNLLEVDGVVIDDRTPGGMAMDEFPLRTSPYALAVYKSESNPGTVLDNVIVHSTCPGQLIEVRCLDNTVVGAEKWSVTAPSEGGRLGDATTGTPYVTSNFEFTVPKVIPPDPTEIGSKMSLKEVQFAPRVFGELEPQICASVPTCGASAKPMTVTCVYTKKPPDDCKCDDVTYEGKLNEKCLGTEVQEGESMAIDSNLQLALKSLYEWRRTFVLSNTSTDASLLGDLKSAYFDLELCDKITDAFSACIQEVYGNVEARTEWAQRFTEMQSDITIFFGLEPLIPSAVEGLTYKAGDIIQPIATKRNRHQYTVISSSSIYTDTNEARGDGQLGAVALWPVDGSTFTVTSQRVETSSGRPYQSTIQLQDSGVLADADIHYESDSNEWRTSVNQFVRRYEAAMDRIRTVAGIIPKKVSASGQGNECWQSREDEYYWSVNGLEYLPAYTNVVYHSCIGRMDGSNVKCTREFAFVIKVKEDCIPRLKVGDKVIFEITGAATGNKSYSINDIYYLPVIAGAPKYAAGGIDGNNTLTWSVRGETSGVLTSLSFNGLQSLDYNLHDLHFKLTRGHIPFALNDQFDFSVENGQFRYRFNNEPWNAPQNIPAAGTVIPLSDGLSAEFISGSKNSFLPNDLFSYEVIQPYSPSNVLSPGYRFYEYVGSTSILTFDFAGPTQIEGFAIGLHTLPTTSVIQLDGLDASDTLIWTVSLSWNIGVISTLFDISKLAYKLRLTLTDAEHGQVGWIWTGSALKFKHSPSEVLLNRTWKSSNSNYLGAGSGGQVTWNGNDSWLYQTEVNELIDLLDYSKVHNDQPLILIPNQQLTSDSRLVRFDSDSIELSEWYQFQMKDNSREDYRVIGTRTLPFVGVIA